VKAIRDDGETDAPRAARYTNLVLSELRRRGDLLERDTGMVAFRCPHCGVGRGLLDLATTAWRCLDCVAAGCAESLAVTLGIDPELRLFEPSELGILAQHGAEGSAREHAIARLTGHLLRRHVDVVVALELVTSWAPMRL
jgi:hypothetical protein